MQQSFYAGEFASGECVCTLAGDMVANLGQQAAQKAVDQMALEKFNQPHQRSG